jgi:hypothetical protein
VGIRAMRKPLSSHPETYIFLHLQSCDPRSIAPIHAEHPAPRATPPQPAALHRTISKYVRDGTTIFYKFIESSTVSGVTANRESPSIFGGPLCKSVHPQTLHCRHICSFDLPMTLPIGKVKCFLLVQLR